MPLKHPNSVPDLEAPLNGEALYIVYPDYPVNTDTWYGYTSLVGHAGALLIDKNGLTKYYEFGRYPPGDDGRVRKIDVPNVVIDGNGKATSDTLKEVLTTLAERSGKGTRIRAAYFLSVDFQKMETVATSAQPNYHVLTNNCGHYAEKIILAGNTKIDKPLIANPMPINFVDEYIEEKNAEVLFDPATGTFSIGQGDESDAKI
ncbi:hypothetical protein [Synechococcus sp. MIT S9507]|uniref:hypothetical protein n=1 Tax=Synechococcus sp. MIT S9507 TaxID=3082544 RepID=UPI0039B3870C